MDAILLQGAKGTSRLDLRITLSSDDNLNLYPFLEDYFFDESTLRYCHIYLNDVNTLCLLPAEIPVKDFFKQNHTYCGTVELSPDKTVSKKALIACLIPKSVFLMLGGYDNAPQKGVNVFVGIKILSDAYISDTTNVPKILFILQKV